MNRADVTMLLRRLHTNYALQRPADNDTIDEWQRQLAGIEPMEAFAALDRIVQSEPKAPSCARVIAEVRARNPVSHTVRPTGDPNCPMCDGTGFVVIHDPANPKERRYGPCGHCRPGHPWQQRRRHTSTVPQQTLDDRSDAEKATAKSLIDGIRASIRHHPSNEPDGAA